MGGAHAGRRALPLYFSRGCAGLLLPGCLIIYAPCPSRQHMGGTRKRRTCFTYCGRARHPRVLGGADTQGPTLRRSPEACATVVVEGQSEETAALGLISAGEEEGRTNMASHMAPQGPNPKGHPGASGAPPWQMQSCKPSGRPVAEKKSLSAAPQSLQSLGSGVCPAPCFPRHHLRMRTRVKCGVLLICWGRGRTGRARDIVARAFAVLARLPPDGHGPPPPPAIRSQAAPKAAQRSP